MQRIVLSTFLCFWASVAVSFSSSLTGMDQRFAPEIKSDYESLLRWSISNESQRYSLVVKRYPPRTPADYDGDHQRYTDKINEIRQRNLQPLIAPVTSALKRASYEVFQKLSPTERLRFVISATDYPTAAGDKVHIAHIFGQNLSHLFSDAEALEALRHIATMTGKVTYNGDRGRFEYENEQQHFQVVIVASIAAEEPKRLFRLFDTLLPDEKAKFQINLNNTNPQSRIEPFDLLQGAVSRHFISAEAQLKISKIALTKAVHRSLYQLLGLTPQQDPRGNEINDVITYQSIYAPEYVSFLCAGADLKFFGKGLFNWHTSGKLIAFSSIDFYDILAADKAGPVELECNGKRQAIETLPADYIPLPLPDSYNIERIATKGAVRVLVNYSLTEETDRKLIAGTIAYMTSKGYLYRGIKKDQDSLAFFKKAFVESDIFIPAAHVIDINNLPLGTKKSHILRFTKRFLHKSGRWIPVEVNAMFPGKVTLDNPYGSTLTRPGLAELLALRRRNLSHSLFVLTSSCFAGSAIITWTNAYRESLELDIAAGYLDSISEARDLIHSIAPRGSYPTSTPSQLIYDFIPALTTIDMLARGHSPELVYNVLREPIRRDLFVKGLSLLERIFGFKAADDGPLMLDPVYNVEMPTILAGGIRLQLGQPMTIRPFK